MSLQTSPIPMTQYNFLSTLASSPEGFIEIYQVLTELQKAKLKKKGGVRFYSDGRVYSAKFGIFNPSKCWLFYVCDVAVMICVSK